MRNKTIFIRDRNSFGEKAVRRAFIRKVYSILMAQLVLTGAIIAAFLFVAEVRLFVQQNRWVYFTSLGVMVACLLAMACCESVRRSFPTNFIFLGIFTVCEGIMLGTISSYYEVEAVLIAVGITAGVTFCLTIFAFQTKIDFTVCGGKSIKDKYDKKVFHTGKALSKKFKPHFTRYFKADCAPCWSSS